jgi:hypothetical protein
VFGFESDTVRGSLCLSDRWVPRFSSLTSGSWANRLGRALVRARV